MTLIRLQKIPARVNKQLRFQQKMRFNLDPSKQAQKMKSSHPSV